MKIKYPRIAELGLTVLHNPCTHVLWKDLRKALLKRGWLRAFNKMFGIQTQYIKGPFPWDVEAVLERLFTGKLTGSQLNWD